MLSFAKKTKLIFGNRKSGDSDFHEACLDVSLLLKEGIL